MHAYQPERLNHKPSRVFLLIDGMLRHPRLCAGAALSLAVMGAICVNAIWYQPGKHPAPLFATRTLDDQSSKPTSLIASLNEGSRSKKIYSKKASKEASGELLREVQTALSVRGYYGGKLDGLYGSKTRSAIEEFQRDHSLKQDGKVSLRLLTQVLMSASSQPQVVPVPKTNQVVRNLTKTKKVRLAASTPADEVDGLVARIQAGLRAYGYDDLLVDGQMGQQTATAIQRFQLDYGMKITGEPSDLVLEKLRDIGAYVQG